MKIHQGCDTKILYHIREDSTDHLEINLSGSITTQYVLSTFMSDNNCHKVKMKEKMKERKTVHDRLASIKKSIESTSMTITARRYHIEKSVLEHALDKKGIRE